MSEIEAVQGLLQRNQELEAKIEELEAENERLQKLVDYYRNTQGVDFI